MRLFAALAVCTTLAAPAVAGANDQRPDVRDRAQDADRGVADDCERVRRQGRKCKFLDITGDDIDGMTPTASGDRIVGGQRVTHSNLIKLRRHFLDRLLRTTERL